MDAVSPAKYKDLKLKLDGIVPPDRQFFRNLLLDQLYASLPQSASGFAVPVRGVCLTAPDREHVTNVEKPW